MVLDIRRKRMYEYQRWSHELTEDNLLATIKEAKTHGYDSLVIINGEYYTIKENE